MKKEYYTDFSLSYRSLIPSPVFFCSAEIFSTYLHQSRADFPVILAAQLLFVFFVRREEFAFLFQTFSRSDPPGKAPLTRGRYVFQKRGEKKERGKKEKKKGGSGGVRE